MASLLPYVLLVMAVIGLFTALVALGISLQRLFGPGDGDPSVSIDVVDEDQAALLAEKRALLTALRDLEFEREVGKVSEQDFARLEAQYRARAKEVLQRLDRDIDPYRQDAERLIAASLATREHTP